MALEANARLDGSNNKCLWPECLVEAAAKHFGGLKAGRTCRGTFFAFERWQTAGLNGLTIDGSAGAEHLKQLKAGQQQVPHLWWSQVPPLPWRRGRRIFPQQLKLMGSSAQNSSGVHWCKRRVRFNEVLLRRFRRRFRRRSGRLWCRARSSSTGFRRRFRRRSGRL